MDGRRLRKKPWRVASAGMALVALTLGGGGRLGSASRPPQPLPTLRLPEPTLPVPPLSPTALPLRVTHTLRSATLPPARADLGPVSFADENDGWVARGNTVLSTIDGGRQWRPAAVLPHVITALDRVSEQVGWAAAGGQLYRTGDGGRRFVPSGAPATQISFASPADGWILSASPPGRAPVYQLAHTTDGGLAWTAVPAPCGSWALTSISAPTPGVVLALCTGSVGVGMEPKRLLVSQDGGRRWSVRAITPQRPGASGSASGLPLVGYAAAIDFATPANGDMLFQGNYRTVMRTTDGGRTWRSLPGLPSPNTNNSVAGVAFPAPGQALLVYGDQQGNALWASQDGQAHWSLRWPALSPDVSPQESSVFGGDHGVTWAADPLPDPTLLRSADGGRRWSAVSGTPAGVRWGMPVPAGAYIETVADGSAHLWFSVGAGGPWQARTLPSDASEVTFVTATVGFATTGTSGRTLDRTMNGGRSWSAVGQIPEGTTLMAFSSARRGWALVAGGHLEGTADGGAVWSQYHVPMAGDMPAIAFNGPDGAIVVVPPGCNGTCSNVTLLTTTDGGITWSARRLAGALQVSGVAILGPAALALDTADGWLFSSDTGGRWFWPTTTVSP